MIIDFYNINGGGGSSSGGTSLDIEVVTQTTHSTTATLQNDDKTLRFDVAGDTIQMDFVKDNTQNTRFLATKEYVDGVNKFMIATFEINETKTIPTVNTTITVSNAVKYDIIVPDEYAEDWRVLFLAKYELFNDGIRIYTFPVSQFTMDNGTKLRTSWCCTGEVPTDCTSFKGTIFLENRNNISH